MYDFFPAKWKAQIFSAFENEPQVDKDQKMLISLFLLHLYLLALPIKSVSQHSRKVNLLEVKLACVTLIKRYL